MHLSKNVFYVSVVVLYLVCMYSFGDTAIRVGLTVLAAAALWFGHNGLDHFESYHDYDRDLSPYNSVESIGEYDNLMLVKKGGHYLKQNDKKLLEPENVYTLQGTPTGLEDSVTFADPAANYPSVDGSDDSPKDMFVFAYNQSSPECCPSTYSTDRGCVCTTDEQRNFISGRGGNNVAPSLF